MTGTRRRFLKGVAGAGAASLAGCTGFVRRLGSTPDSPPSERAATQFRGGLRRRGVAPERTVPADVRVDWRIPDVNTGEHTAAKASPVRAPDGDVIIAGDTGELRRVTPAGEVVWTAATDADGGRGIHGTPAIANGAVYVGAYDGALYAFDLATGQRFWRTQVGDAIGSSPAYHDGRVYIAVEYYDPSGAMYALDAVTGEVVWDDQRPTNHPHSTCAIDRDAGRLVVGANDGRVYAWSYPDLTFQWTFETGRPIKGPVAAYDGGAFFGSWDERVYRVALADGTETWRFDTGANVMSGPSVDPRDGTVYVGSNGSGLYALDAASGERRWRFDTEGPVLGCPVVTSQRVLAGSYDGNLYAVSREHGREVWRADLHGWVTATPLVTDGAVYVADRATRAFLDGRDGPSGSLFRLVEA